MLDSSLPQLPCRCFAFPHRLPYLFRLVFLICRHPSKMVLASIICFVLHCIVLSALALLRYLDFDLCILLSRNLISVSLSLSLVFPHLSADC